MSTRARIVPAAHGIGWLTTGWRLFRRAPLGWLAVSFAYVFVTQALSLVPWIGALVALATMPGLSLGLMACARAGSHGEPIGPQLLAEGFRHEPRRQLALGGLYLACSLAVFGATMLADESGALRTLLRGGGGEAPALADMALPLAVFGLLGIPVMLAFWFSPALVGWHSVTVIKALFFSLAAAFMNWRAFLAYGAASFLAALVPALALQWLSGMLGAAIDAWTAALPVALLLLPTYLASFYASYRDVFGYHSVE